jgi:hypothetical protein
MIESDIKDICVPLLQVVSYQHQTAPSPRDGDNIDL